MIAPNTFIESDPYEASSIDWIVHGLMAAVLTLLPFAFGGTQPWSQEIFFVLTTALVIAILIRAALDPAIMLQWNWAYLPMLIFISLVVLQLISLPSSFVSHISPHTTALRSSLLADQLQATGNLAHQTLSLYPQETAENLRLVLAVSGIFFVVTQFYRLPNQIEILLLSIAGVGFAVSLLAVYQDATGATMIYGIVPVQHRDSGPFMNYSHFSQFMNLSIGASLGAALLRTMSVIQETSPQIRSLRDLKHFLSESRMRLVCGLAIAIVIEAVTIFLSMSRMGAISLMSAGALTGLLLSWRTRSRDQGSILLILGIVVLAALLCVGFDAVYDRLATVQHVQTAQGGRLEMLRDMVGAVKQFPLLGTGLGSYEYVFPMFDHSPVQQIATHSEDEFAQLLQEGGSIGLLLAISFLAIIAWNGWKCIRRPVTPVRYVAFGVSFGLIAILIHSFSDFGQHAPANAVLTACSAGLLVNIASLSPRPKNMPFRVTVDRETRLRFAALAKYAAIAVALAAGGWCVAGANAARIADDVWDNALLAASQLRTRQWQGDDDDYIALLTPATLATQLQPDNVKYRYWLNMYRWRSLLRASKQSPRTLELKKVALPFVSRIVADLTQAELLCPTYGPSYSLAGELEYFVLHRPEGRAHVNEGFRLTPNDPIAGFITGEFAVDEHRWTDALAAFRTASQLGADKRDAMELLVRKANHPEIAYQLAESDGPSLQYLIELLADRPQDQALAARCRNDLVAQLQTAADQPTASADTLAALADRYAAQGEKSKAISYFRKAIALDYSRVDWHYRLAGLLGETGDTAGGMAEARICLRIRPQMKEATTLLGNLSVQPHSSS